MAAGIWLGGRVVWELPPKVNVIPELGHAWLVEGPWGPVGGEGMLETSPGRCLRLASGWSSSVSVRFKKGI